MINNIVFSGGAFRGPAFFGTIRALQEIKKKNPESIKVQTIVGNSIGSMYGLFYLFDLPWDVLLKRYLELDFTQLMCMGNVLQTHSITTQSKLKKVIADVLKEHNINPEITFIESYKLTGIHYFCNAINIDTRKHVMFECNSTPELKILDAVMASSCLPLLFPPVVINGERYYDGGICNACPSDYVSETSTIAFSLYVKGESTKEHPIGALIKTITFLLHEGKQCENIYYILEGSECQKSFHDLMYKVNQTRDEIFTLYMYGYKKSLEVLHSRNSITYSKT